MSRLIFDSATIGNTTITGITVEGLEISKEANTVEIEDGQILNESFTGSITIRAIGESGALADATVSTDGSIPTKTNITLNGAGSSPNVQLTGVYVMGHLDFSNGRVESVFTATRVDTNQNVVDTTS